MNTGPASLVFPQTYLGPINTMRHVSVPSTFHIRSVRMICVHTVRRVPSPFHIRSVRMICVHTVRRVPSPFHIRSVRMVCVHTVRRVPSPFHIRSVRMVCVHTVRLVPSPSKTAHDTRPAITCIRYAAHCHGMHFPLFVNY